MVEKVVKTNFFHDSSRFGGPKEEVFGIIKMVARVVKNNFFHHFREKQILRNSWKKWKKLSKPTFSTTQAVLEAQIVKKIGFDNFFHHFYDSKDFLRNSWKKWKKLAWPRFRGLNRGKCW